jgi:methionine-R-sulfoxide reductase
MKIITLLVLFFGCGMALVNAEPSSSSSKKDQKKTKDTNIVKNIVESSKAKKDGEVCELPKTDAELRKLLSPEQYRIMKENGTERPFENKYWNNKHPGIYVDLISNEALFSSKDKFDSNSGWPSFSKPIKDERVVEKKDATHGMTRTEVRSKTADAHLGHVFDDGPADAGGLRFCINSAALKFVPLEKMEEMGYDKFLPLFDKKDWEKANKEPYKN